MRTNLEIESFYYLFLGFFLPVVESGSPQILILPIAESSVVHKILLQLFQSFPLTVCGKFESLLFPRTMEQRTPWKSSHWNRVQYYGRIERGDGSISFIMHHRKPAAVFPASQRCLEGGQSCCRIRSSHNQCATSYPAAALAAL